MLVQQAQQLENFEIQQRGMSVRHLWSGEQRLRRRVAALERQQQLFDMLKMKNVKGSLKSCIKCNRATRSTTSSH